MYSQCSSVEDAYILIAHKDNDYLEDIRAKIMEREGISSIDLDQLPVVYSFIPSHLTIYSFTLPDLRASYPHAVLIKCPKASTVIADLMEEVSDIVCKVRNEGIVCIIPEHCVKKLNELDAKVLHPAFHFRDLVRLEGILFYHGCKDKWAMFENIAQAALENGWIKDKDQFVKDISKRERIQSTGIGDGIALPHTRSEAVVTPFLFMLLCQSDFEFESVDRQPVRLIMLLGLPAKGPSHLPIISELTQVLLHEENRKSLLACKNKQEVVQFFNEEK